MKVVASYTYVPIRRIDNGEGKNCIGVFLANDPAMGGLVAVKEILKKDFPNAADYFREAEAMFHSEHRNVVPIRIACETDDRVCLVMKYYDRGSLAARIANGPLSLKRALRDAQHILNGLGQIHAGRSVHLDIKPSNILFNQNDRPMIADFGQARRMGPLGYAPLPSRMYETCVPPECFSDNLANEAADIYQAGQTIYCMLNGYAVFSDQWNRFPSAAAFRDAVRSGRFPRRDGYLPHVPRSVRTIVNKALSVDPDDRFEAAADFADALGNVGITHDWHTTERPDGGYNWRTRRVDQPDVVAEMAKNGLRWNVSFFTERGGRRRRMAGGLSVTGLPRATAFSRLHQEFRAMEA
ncbi:MAG: serine/threonine-protein kinase [Planctomycetaceae bacterium]